MATVGSMTNDAPARRCYLVEWYQRGPVAVVVTQAAERLIGVAAERSDGDAVLLLMALTVPGDHTLFGVFAATSLDAVIDTCQRAGWPADRISSDVHPWPMPTVP